MHPFIVFTIVCSIGLSTQCSLALYKHTIEFPINAISIVNGESIDPLTNQSYKISGVIKFQQLDCSSNVTVEVDIVGLPPKVTQRGLHIHAYGISEFSDNITTVCGSTGPHFNPTNSTHGLLTSFVRHGGDLGNVITSENGSISVTFENDMISLYDHQYSIIGRSVVLHESIDDGGVANTDASRNTGSSGKRIACGVVGLTKPVGQIVQREFLQGVSPAISDVIDEKIKGSWIFDFIKSQVESLKLQMSNNNNTDTDIEDDDEDIGFVSPSVIIPNSDIAPTGLLYQIWGNFVKSKQDLGSLFGNNNEDYNGASVIAIMDGEDKRSN